MRRTKLTITFLVDTREQRPLAFGPPIRTDYFSGATTLVTTLKEGDYSPDRPVVEPGPASLRLNLLWLAEASTSVPLTVEILIPERSEKPARLAMRPKKLSTLKKRTPR